MEKLTLQKFEEAAEKVKEVTLQTNLVYSEYFSAQSGNKVYLKPENMQYTGAYKVRGAYYKMRRVLLTLQRSTVLRQLLLCRQQHHLSK